MLRRTDVIGFTGLAMLVAGAVLFLTGSDSELTWVYWMTGTCIWFVGFGVLLGWIIWRAGTLGERPAVKTAAGRKH